MDIQQQHDPQLQAVADLVHDIQFAMVTATGADGVLRSRPMTVMQMDAEGCLWFFTSRAAAKTEDAAQQSAVNLALARPDQQDYLSLSGNAEVVRDPAKMKALWTPWIKPWFPDGLDDPQLTLLKVTLVEAEYWEAPGSAVKRLYALAKGMMTGNTNGLGEHRRIRI